MSEDPEKQPEISPKAGEPEKQPEISPKAEEKSEEILKQPEEPPKMEKKRKKKKYKRELVIGVTFEEAEEEPMVEEGTEARIQAETPSDEEITDIQEKIDIMLRALESNQLMVRATAEQQLKETGEPAVPKLIENLGREDYWTVRFGCADALGYIKDPRAIDPFIKYLKDEDPDFRMKVADNLGKMHTASGIKKVVSPLIEVLDDDNHEVRQYAALALGKIGDIQAVDKLVTKLQDEVPDVRFEATRALGMLADAKAAMGLIERLGDSATKVRAAAALALGLTRSPLGVIPLLNARLDNEKTVKDAAALGITNIAEKDILVQVEQAAQEDKMLKIQHLQDVGNALVATETETRFPKVLEIREELKQEFLPPLEEKINMILGEQREIAVRLVEGFSAMRQISTLQDLQTLKSKIRSDRIKLNAVDFRPFLQQRWIIEDLYGPITDSQLQYRENEKIIAELENVTRMKEQQLKEGVAAAAAAAAEQASE
ncbi:MAG: HEAT repeat domain-containing protein [Candidatus Hodarchaeota archaeon]